MKTLTYQNKTIPIYKIDNHNFLITNKDLANICMVFEKLLNLTRQLNIGNIIIKDKHYIEKDGIKYWTKTGIVRICILLQNEESIDFSIFIEEL